MTHKSRKPDKWSVTEEIAIRVPEPMALQCIDSQRIGAEKIESNVYLRRNMYLNRVITSGVRV
jgi:hypothetical protein